jgi:hypothetical protein
MAVPAINLVIEKGTSFSQNFKLKLDGDVLDLTGYAATSKMRRHYQSSDYYTFTTTPLVPLTAGIINIGMASSITSTLPQGRYVYDILVTFAGSTTKVIEGNILVKGTAS